MGYTEENNRIVYFDLLRICATIAVIVLHVAGMNWQHVDVDSYEWNVFNVADSAVRWAVPIFVMISGALFLDSDRTINIKNIYKKNIVRIVTAFIFWSAVYSIDGYMQGIGAKETIVALIKGNYHLWFLFMIIMLYILIPVLRKITESKKTMEYFLIVSIAVSVVLPSTFTLLEIINIPHTATLISSLKSAFSNVTSNIGFGYTTYYILGLYLAKHDVSIKVQRISYVLGVLGFISTIILTFFSSNKLGKPYELFYSSFSINVMLMVIGIFVFFKYVISKKKWKEKYIKIISKLAKYSFGVYLVHDLVIDKLKLWMQLDTLAYDPITSIIIIVSCVTIISYIIAAIINTIPLLKRYIV